MNLYKQCVVTILFINKQTDVNILSEHRQYYMMVSMVGKKPNAWNDGKLIFVAAKKQNTYANQKALINEFCYQK